MDFVEFAGEFINKRYIASIVKVDANMSNSNPLYYLKVIIVISQKTINLEMSFNTQLEREEKIEEIRKSSLSFDGSFNNEGINREEVYIGAYL